jgi:hypothetical protein
MNLQIHELDRKGKKSCSQSSPANSSPRYARANVKEKKEKEKASFINIWTTLKLRETRVSSSLLLPCPA